MKLFCVALLALSSAVFACADFSGHYQCQSGDEVSEMTVTQNGNHFSVDSHDGDPAWEYIADGVTRDVQLDLGNGQSMILQQTVTCSGETFTTTIRGSQDPISIDGTMVVTRVAEGQLQLHSHFNVNNQITQTLELCRKM